MHYCPEYAVEIGDTVEVQRLSLFGNPVEAEIIHIYERKRLVRVRYYDEEDMTKAGNPRRRTAVVPIESCDLIGRSM